MIRSAVAEIWAGYGSRKASEAAAGDVCENVERMLSGEHESACATISEETESEDAGADERSRKKRNRQEKERTMTLLTCTNKTPEMENQRRRELGLKARHRRHRQERKVKMCTPESGKGSVLSTCVRIAA